MEVFLFPDLERFVDDAVAKGEFESREDVVLAGVVRLREDDESEHERLRAMIQEGIDDLEQGRSRSADDVFRDLFARHAARLPAEASEAA